MEFLKAVALFFAIVFTIAIVSVGGLYVGGWFDKEREGIRRDVYENSAAYNQGIERELMSYCSERQREMDPRAVEMLNGAIRHTAASVDIGSLPVHLRGCVNSAMGGGVR